MKIVINIVPGKSRTEEKLNKMDLELGFWWEEENEIAKSTSE